MAPSLSLSEVVDKLCAGEEGALDLLMEQTRGMAFRLAHSIVPDRDRCQDVMRAECWPPWSSIDCRLAPTPGSSRKSRRLCRK